MSQSETYESGFSFTEYLIKKSVLEVNENYIPETNKKVKLDVNFSTNFNINEAMDQAIVILSCTLFKGFREENYPFYLFVEIVGNFTLAGDYSKIEIKQFCQINATAILFPYLRAYISQITAISSMPHILLPTINVMKLLDINIEE